MKRTGMLINQLSLVVCALALVCSSLWSSWTSAAHLKAHVSVRHDKKEPRAFINDNFDQIYAICIDRYKHPRNNKPTQDVGVYDKLGRVFYYRCKTEMVDFDQIRGLAQEKIDEWQDYGKLDDDCFTREGLQVKLPAGVETIFTKLQMACLEHP